MKARIKPLQLKTFLAGAVLALAATASAQDHGHLYISATSQIQGAPLYFDNASAFELSSGYVKMLTLNSNAASRYNGRYEGNITVTPRSTNTLRGADYGPNAAAPGSVIYFQITNVAGPTGGSFEFWEATGSQPAFSIPVGNGATNVVKVTDASGAPGGDPYGHIHGRRFSATQPGIYLVTVQAHDLSTNGPGSGPIHIPSAPVTIAFQAGFVVASVSRPGTATTVTFGTALTHDFTLQATTNLLLGAWRNVGTRLRGTDYFQTVVDSTTNPATFYRVLAEPFIP